MIKFAGAVLFIIATTYIGCAMSGTLTARKQFLQQFITFLNTLKTYIRFNSGEIRELVISCADSKPLEPIRATVENTPDKQFSQVWQQAVAAIPTSTGLSKEDKQLLLEFGSALGTTDVEGQINHIDLYSTLFQTALDDAIDNYVKKSKLYKMLGLFSGTATALMIL